jgi:DNA-binding NarL/FixJ family response regulator
MGRVDVERPWPEKYARNVRIVALFADGRTLREIAERVDTPLSNVSIILRQAGIYPAVGRQPREVERREGNRTKREVAIAKARAMGKTLAAIGARYGVSKQRISQILAAMPPEERTTHPTREEPRK